MDEEKNIRVDGMVSKSENEKLVSYANTKYRGNRRLVIEEAVDSLIKRKGL